MNKYNSIDIYIADLEMAMEQADDHLIHNAIFDAEEHLAIMIDEMMDSGGYRSYVDAIATACEKYGAQKRLHWSTSD